METLFSAVFIVCISQNLGRCFVTVFGDSWLEQCKKIIKTVSNKTAFEKLLFKSKFVSKAANETTYVVSYVFVSDQCCLKVESFVCILFINEGVHLHMPFLIYSEILARAIGNPRPNINTK